MPDALEVFLAQMLMIFTASQAITETLKQTLLKFYLVDKKQPTGKVLSASQEKDEALRQNVVRWLTILSGIGLSWATGLDPFKVITSEPVTLAAPIRYTLVGITAYFGAPLFNDLVNVVRAWKEQKAKLAKEATVVTAAAWQPGDPVAPSLREHMIGLYLQANPSVSRDKAEAAVDKDLGRIA